MARFAYETIIDIETGEILEAKYFDWDGPVALCKGGNSKNEMNRANQLQTEQFQITQQQLAKQNQVFQQMNQVLNPILQNGGMLPQQQAALTSIAMNSLPATYNSLEGRILEQLQQRGITGGQFAGGGGVANMFGQLGSQEAQAQAGLLSNIQNQKAGQLFQGLGIGLGEAGALGGSVGTFNQGTLGALGAGVQAANNVDQAQTGFWGSLLGGLGAIGGRWNMPVSGGQ